MKNSIISKQQVIKSINTHLLTLLPIKDEHKKIITKPEELITRDRFDIMAKYIYIKSREKNIGLLWALNIYKQHLNTFGDFIEGDSSGKNTFEDYVEAFDSCIDSIKSIGFDENRTMIPINNNQVVVDGAHRVAACIYYQKLISAIIFTTDSNKYDYEYFLYKGLSENILDSMALEYARLKTNTVIAFLFPVANNKDKEVVKILNDYCNVWYHKEILLTTRGRRNFIRMIYKGEAWVGNLSQDTPGFIKHVGNRFIDGKPLKVYFLESDNPLKTQEAKTRIRLLFNIGNDAIHINDTHTETIRLSEQLLNQNSRHFINYAQPENTPFFHRLFQVYRSAIEDNNLDKELFCIDGSSVLSAYGLREPDDLDYLHSGKDLQLDSEHSYKINSHNEELFYHGIALTDLIGDSNNFFYYDGMKFLSLDKLKSMKTRRNEVKDLHDISLIQKLECNDLSYNYIRREALFILRKFIYYIKKGGKDLIKYCVPRQLFPLIKKIRKIPFYVNEYIGAYYRKILYKGYSINYTRGTSLIKRLYNNATYEPELTWKMLEILKQKEKPHFIDIGANIGLISINIISALPNSIIYAFEPGPHQNELFNQTILDNSLSEKIKLNNNALGEKKGYVDFEVHDSKHVSGDGLMDTGRSGLTKTIKVTMNTLDDWWEKMGKPEIDVVKIDTEGAELWVLNGSSNLLAMNGPVLFLEINNKNLDAYPYTALDIIEFLNSKGYKTETLGGTPVNGSNLDECLNITQDFVAMPKRIKEGNKN